MLERRIRSPPISTSPHRLTYTRSCSILTANRKCRRHTKWRTRVAILTNTIGDPFPILKRRPQHRCRIIWFRSEAVQKEILVSFRPGLIYGQQLLTPPYGIRRPPPTQENSTSQKEMDLLSLLNSSAGTNLKEAEDIQRHQPQESVVEPVPPSWAGLPTPSPEKSPARTCSDEYRPALKSRTPWDAGGYSLPLSLDTKFFPSTQKPAIYSESVDSTSISALSAVTPSSGHSRSTSLESSPADMVSSALVSPMTISQAFKYVDCFVGSQEYAWRFGLTNPALMNRPAFLGEVDPQLEIYTGRR